MRHTIPPVDNNTLLQRKDAAAALSAAGYPIALPTLATMACKGTGPKFKRFGRRPLYRWGDLLEWAENRSTVSHPLETAREAAAWSGSHFRIKQRSSER